MPHLYTRRICTPYLPLIGVVYPIYIYYMLDQRPLLCMHEGRTQIVASVNFEAMFLHVAAILILLRFQNLLATRNLLSNSQPIATLLKCLKLVSSDTCMYTV